MMFLKMGVLAGNSPVYSEAALSVRTWARQNHLLDTGVTGALPGTLISSCFCVPYITEETISFK